MQIIKNITGIAIIIMLIHLSAFSQNISNTDINVIRQTNTGCETIYTGSVSEYSDGILRDINFSENRFIISLNWSDEENEFLIISPVKNAEEAEIKDPYPIESENTAPDNIENANTNDYTEPKTETESVNNDVISTVISAEHDYDYTITDIEIYSADGTRVNSLQNGSIASKVILSKNTDNDNSVTLFAAIYDGSFLKTIKMLNLSLEQTLDEYVSYDININLENITKNSSLKIMILDKATFKPYSLPFKVNYGYKINVSAVENQRYTVPISSSGDAELFNLTFDNEYFVAEISTTDSTNSLHSGITISRSSPDIVLRAKKTGNTYIDIAEIK